MQEKNFVKVFRIAKIIQLIVLVVFEVVFFLILLLHPTMSKQIYDDSTLFTLCAVTWSFMIFYLLSLLYDFYQLRKFAAESHALNRVAFLDSLTGIPNRHGLDVVFRTYDSPESMAEAGCFMATIDNLKEINETLGYPAGNSAIQDFCSIFETVGDEVGVVGRNGGNDYVAVINQCTDEMMQRFIVNLNAQLETYNTEHPDSPLYIRHTYILNNQEHLQAFTQLLTATYNKLHTPG